MKNGGTTMARIDVKAEGKKYKVMRNMTQVGSLYSSPSIANQQARQLHDKHYPSDELHLLDE
jgi:hypothetical protein